MLVNNLKPFYLQHLELHLKPIFESRKLTFWFNKSEYLEGLIMAEVPEYLYIIKSRLEILYWTVDKHWYNKGYIYSRIIPCGYNQIEKENKCIVYEVIYRDMEGNVLK